VESCLGGPLRGGGTLYSRTLKSPGYFWPGTAGSAVPSFGGD
jgi:hypothetical protein